MKKLEVWCCGDYVQDLRQLPPFGIWKGKFNWSCFWFCRVGMCCIPISCSIFVASMGSAVYLVCSWSEPVTQIQTPQRNTTQIDFAFTNKSTDRLKIDKLHSEMQLCDQGLRDSILYTLKSWSQLCYLDKCWQMTSYFYFLLWHLYISSTAQTYSTGLKCKQKRKYWI